MPGSIDQVGRIGQRTVGPVGRAIESIDRGGPWHRVERRPVAGMSHLLLVGCVMGIVLSRVRLPHVNRNKLHIASKISVQVDETRPGPGGHGSSYGSEHDEHGLAA